MKSSYTIVYGRHSYGTFAVHLLNQPRADLHFPSSKRLLMNPCKSFTVATVAALAGMVTT